MKTHWEIFLRIRAEHVDEAPAVDEAWASSRGIGELSPHVVRLLRREVLPTVRMLQRRYGVHWFCFLIHNRDSGVPTTPDDRSAYVHLRFRLDGWKLDEVAKIFSDRWTLLREVEWSKQIAGISPALEIDFAWQLLCDQSKWLLDLVEAHAPEVDDATVIQHLRQFLHFFANMAQIRVA